MWFHILRGDFSTTPPPRVKVQWIFLEVAWGVLVRRGGLFLIYPNTEIIALCGHPSSRHKPVLLFTFLLWVSRLLSFFGLRICSFLASLIF